jgi:hypothetical protein
MEISPNHSLVSEGYYLVPNEQAEKDFALEIDSWCSALKRFPEPLTSKLMYALINEMSGSFLKAVNGHFAFDLVRLAKRLYEISEAIINEKELVFYILAHLPNPTQLDVAGLSTFEEIVAEAEKVYPDVVQKLKNRLKNQANPK